MDNSSGRFKHFEYNITGDDRDIDERDNITREIRAILKDTFFKVQGRKHGVIKELNQLIEKYPGIPQFKNHLFIAYAQDKNMEMAHQVNELTVEKHPDYLFAKLNLVGKYLGKSEYEKVPQVLGPLMEIKALYPHRNIFHLNEVASFYKIAIHYFLAIGNIEAAETRLEILEGLPRDLTTDVKELLFLVRQAKMKKEWKKETTQNDAQPKNTITKFVVEPTTELPVFYHPVVEKLYHHNLLIDQTILREILDLPGETLLSDLHKVIYDSIARFDIIAGANVDERESSFLLHALFLLGEIGNESSLPVILDMLRQEEEYLDFYFGDHLTETLWAIILNLGMHQTDSLKQFILEGNYYEFARSAVTSAMKQLALNFPERKEEVIQWYNDILHFFLANKDDNSLIDTGLISSMVSDLIDLKAVKLKPLIEELYREDLIWEMYVGSLESVKEELHSVNNLPSSQKKDMLSIFAQYDHILTTWASHKEDGELVEEEDWNDDEFYGNFGDEDFTEDVVEVTQPVVRSEPKIGRNDPCPCGSGNKYKKCHGR